MEQNGEWGGWGNESGMHEDGINDIAGCGELAYIIEVWDEENIWLSVENENSVIVFVVVGFVVVWNDFFLTS